MENFKIIFKRYKIGALSHHGQTCFLTVNAVPQAHCPARKPPQTPSASLAALSSCHGRLAASRVASEQFCRLPQLRTACKPASQWIAIPQNPVLLAALTAESQASSTAFGDYGHVSDRHSGPNTGLTQASTKCVESSHVTQEQRLLR